MNNKLRMSLISLVCIISGLVIAFILFEDSVSAHNAISFPSSTASNDCYAMDVVVIIDQSGSMSGGIDITGEPFQANDPNKRREQAAEHAMNWLASNKIGGCKDAVHRIGVVGFGSSSRTYMNLTEINPTDYTDWNKDFKIYQDMVISENLKSTDHKLGFSAAKTLFNNVDSLGSLPRKKVIIMITDGRPHVYSRGSSPEAIRIYLEELVKQVGEDFPFAESVRERDQAFKEATNIYGSFSNIPLDVKANILTDYPVTNDEYENSYYIFIMAMNAAVPYLDDVGSYFAEISLAHGGRDIYDLANNESSVLIAIDDILSWVSGQNAIVGECGPVPINPYLSGGALDFYKVNTSVEIVISLDRSNPIGKGGEDFSGTGDSSFWGVTGYSSYDISEHWVFSNPPAGMWYFETDTCSNIKSSFKLFEAVIKSDSSEDVFPYYNFDGDIFDPAYPYSISIKIEDEDTGDFLINDPKYPLDVSAEVTSPGGALHTIQFAYNASRKEWVSDTVPVNELGTFTYRMVANAPCVGYPSDSCPNEFFVLFEHMGSYGVRNVAPVFFEIIDVQPVLEDGSIFPVHGKPLELELIPFEVTVQVLNADKNPFSYSEWIESSATPYDIFNAALRLPGGETILADMVPLPGDGSQFFASFVFNEEDDRIIEGTYKVSITMNDTWRHDEFYAPHRFLELEVDRFDPFFRKPWVWLLIKSIIGSIIALIIGFLIYNNTNVVRGMLVFSSTSEGLKNFGLRPSTRTVTIRKHPDLRDLKLSSFTVKNANSTSKQRVTATLNCDNGKVINLSLTDVVGGGGGTSASYTASDHKNWRVSYQGKGNATKKSRKKRPDPNRSSARRRRTTQGGRRKRKKA